MTKFIALLRGINVGGKNKIMMHELKRAFEKSGFKNVVTYINSGNVIFESSDGEMAVKEICEKIIFDNFALKIPVCVISADEFCDAVGHAPDWWNKDKDSKHNALFVIPPMAATQVCEIIGETKPEYEKILCFGRVLFWSAPIATFSRTRLTEIVSKKVIYNSVTIRNANTTYALLKLVK